MQLLPYSLLQPLPSSNSRIQIILISQCTSAKGRDQKMAIYAPLQKCKFVLLSDWGIFPQYNKLYFMMISLILIEKWQVLLPYPHSIYKILPISSFYCWSKYFILTVNLHEFVREHYVNVSITCRWCSRTAIMKMRIYSIAYIVP